MRLAGIKSGLQNWLLAGGRERGAPPDAEVVPRDRLFSTEHPVGLFEDPRHS